MTQTTQERIAPISEARVRECLDSASYWSSGPLRDYAAKLSAWATVFAVVAAVLGAVTGLSVWTTLSDNPGRGAQFFVTAIALLTALVGSLPKIFNFHEGATAAQELHSAYGHQKGELEDALEVVGKEELQTYVRKVVDEFESVKKRKDQLSPLPRKALRERQMKPVTSVR